MGFGTAGVSNSGGSGGFHILAYTETLLGSTQNAAASLLVSRCDNTLFTCYFFLDMAQSIAIVSRLPWTHIERPPVRRRIPIDVNSGKQKRSQPQSRPTRYSPFKRRRI